VSTVVAEIIVPAQSPVRTPLPLYSSSCTVAVVVVDGSFAGLGELHAASALTMLVAPRAKNRIARLTIFVSSVDESRYPFSVAARGFPDFNRGAFFAETLSAHGQNRFASSEA
jgi:hypothetical protein